MQAAQLQRPHSHSNNCFVVWDSGESWSVAFLKRELSVVPFRRQGTHLSTGERVLSDLVVCWQNTNSLEKK